MTTPTASLRLQVIDRIVTVLQAITAGANYWITPDAGAVVKRFVPWDMAVHFPTYMVLIGPGGKIDLSGAAGDDSEYTEDFYVMISVIVKNAIDVVTQMEHCLADIRKAIDTDSRSGTAGTLGALAVETRIEDPMEPDYLLIGDYAFFDQKIRVSVAGKYGE